MPPNWLNHPKFVGVRDQVLNDLRRKEYHFRKVGTVIFLCGGMKSPRREYLKRYFHRARPETLIFYAEAAWTVIARQEDNANALEMEEKLAELADVVIVIVESEGAIAELGAFSISPPLRQKLLPIIDLNFQGVESFINTGPVRWVDLESKFSPTIWCTLETILESVLEIEERLDRLPSATSRHRVPNLSESPKHLLFFLCDIIAVFGPCTADQVKNLANAVVEARLDDASLFVALGQALGILKSITIEQAVYFYRPLTNHRLQSFHYTKKYIDIPTLRARVVSGMQRCAAGNEILHHLRGEV